MFIIEKISFIVIKWVFVIDTYWDIGFYYHTALIKMDNFSKIEWSCDGTEMTFTLESLNPRGKPLKFPSKKKLRVESLHTKITYIFADKQGSPFLICY